MTKACVITGQPDPEGLSTRNRLAGEITEVKIGRVIATVKVLFDGGEQIVTASIKKEGSRNSAWLSASWRVYS